VILVKNNQAVGWALFRRSYTLIFIRISTKRRSALDKPDITLKKVDEIVDVAGRLFSQKGYDATSLKEIAEHVGLHKTSLFHYFKNKESVLMEVMDKSLKEHLHILDEIVNDSHLTGKEKFRLALEKQVLVTCKYKDHINVYLTEVRSLSPANQKKCIKRRKQYEAYFEKIIREGQAESKSDLFKGLDPTIVNLGILGMCNWIIKWYYEAGRLKPEEIFDIFYKLLTGSKD